MTAKQDPHAELCAWANGLRPDSLKRVSCPECGGGGQVCIGNSNSEGDGFAPILARCETCDGDGWVYR